MVRGRISSSFKFIQKLWNLHLKIIREIKFHEKNDDEEITIQTHRFVKKMTENIERFSYNKIVANLHEIHSFFNKSLNKKYKKDTLIENYHKILILMQPVIPHFASECLKHLETDHAIFWPKFDENLVEENETKIVIQVNGKKKEVISCKKGLDEKNIINLIMEMKTKKTNN